MDHKQALKEVVKEMYSLTDWRPYGTDNTGLFDVTCSPAQRRMEVKIRVRFAFDSAYGGTERADFKRKMIAQVDKYWSGRFRLLLSINPANLKLGPAKPVSPFVFPILPTFTVEESAQQTHFTVNVSDTRFSRSFVNTDQQCALFRGTDDDFQSSLHNKLQHREGLLGKIGNTVMPIPGKDAVTYFRQAEDRPIAFQPNLADYAVVGRTELDALGRLLKQELPTFELVTIQVVGHTTKSEAATLGLQRAEKVRRDLVAAGVPAPQLVARASKSPGTAKVPSVMLKLEKNARAKLVKEPHPWPVAAHEFGHMLGLLDEYIPDGDHDATEFRAFSDDCVKYGNLVKPRFGVRGTSIMSWGYHLFPAHYVPVARTLDKMVKEKVRTLGLTTFDGHMFQAAISIIVDPLALKTKVEQENPINYLDWYKGEYAKA